MEANKKIKESQIMINFLLFNFSLIQFSRLMLVDTKLYQLKKGYEILQESLQY